MSNVLVRGACTFSDALASVDLGVNARKRDAFSRASNDKEYRYSLKDDKGNSVCIAYTRSK